MTQPNNYVLEGSASNQVSVLLVRIFSWIQTSISNVNFSVKLNFKPISKLQFEISEAMRILEYVIFERDISK
jgi:hypothetical protein